MISRKLSDWWEDFLFDLQFPYSNLGFWVRILIVTAVIALFGVTGYAMPRFLAGYGICILTTRSVCGLIGYVGVIGTLFLADVFLFKQTRSWKEIPLLLRILLIVALIYNLVCVFAGEILRRHLDMPLTGNARGYAAQNTWVNEKVEACEACHKQADK